MSESCQVLSLNYYADTGKLKKKCLYICGSFSIGMVFHDNKLKMLRKLSNHVHYKGIPSIPFQNFNPQSKRKLEKVSTGLDTSACCLPFCSYFCQGQITHKCQNTNFSQGRLLKKGAIERCPSCL